MPRSPRADSVRNGAALRSAAVDVFRSKGLDAPLEEIARRAGVSIGTLYNHFPQRRALLDAVLPDAARAQLDRITAATRAPADPGTRWAAYLREVLAVQSSDRLLGDVLTVSTAVPDEVAAACAEVVSLGEAALAEARAPGVGPTLSPEGLRALLIGNSVVQRAGPPRAGTNCSPSSRGATPRRPRPRSRATGRGP